MAILDGIDQAIANEGRKINESKTNRRRAKHLIKLAFGQSDIMTIANKILTESLTLAELQRIVDERTYAEGEADLEETIRD